MNFYRSRYKNGVWSKPKKLAGEVNSNYWEGGASISADGKTLYFDVKILDVQDASKPAVPHGPDALFDRSPNDLSGPQVSDRYLVRHDGTANR